MPGPAFDRYVFVDWSARSGPGPAVPGRDSVGIGVGARGAPPRAAYCRTRQEGAARVLAVLLAAHARGERVLVGFDFSYGLPIGSAAAAGLQPGWRGAWTAIADRLTDVDNRSDRFRVGAGLNAAISGGEGPFWGCPASARVPGLAPRSPGFPFRARNGVALGRLRACERRLPGTQEIWKLYGAGSVGSQSLTGLPRVRALRHHPDLAADSVVWPFETGFTRRLEAAVVHAEVWPGLVRDRAVRRAGVLDRAQVLSLCEWAAELDGRGALAPWFDRPSGLAARAVDDVLAEEGWTLGAR